MANVPPDDAPAPRATRDQVLAWIRETGKGSKAAAKHFGLSESTVKSMRRRERELTGERPKTPPPRRPTEAGLVTVETVDHITANTVAAIELRLQVLADPESTGLRSQKDTAIALGILVDKLEKLSQVARIVRADDDLDGDGPRAREAAAGRVRAALGVDPRRKDGD